LRPCYDLGPQQAESRQYELVITLRGIYIERQYGVCWPVFERFQLFLVSLPREVGSETILVFWSVREVSQWDLYHTYIEVELRPLDKGVFHDGWDALPCSILSVSVRESNVWKTTKIARPEP
jgi:hypothetical protein